MAAPLLNSIYLLTILLEQATTKTPIDCRRLLARSAAQEGPHHHRVWVPLLLVHIAFASFLVLYYLVVVVISRYIYCEASLAKPIHCNHEGMHKNYSMESKERGRERERGRVSRIIDNYQVLSMFPFHPTGCVHLWCL